MDVCKVNTYVKRGMRYCWDLRYVDELKWMNTVDDYNGWTKVGELKWMTKVDELKWMN